LFATSAAPSLSLGLMRRDMATPSIRGARAGYASKSLRIN
jgi:hypothetical protein